MTNIFEAILEQQRMKKKTKKQQQVLDVAIQLFAEKGYANTSTAEIAKMAGVSEGTIFKHYGTKDRLLLSIIVPFLSEFFPKMAKELFQETLTEKTETFEQFLRALLHNRIEFIKNNKEIFQVVIKELVYNDELRKEMFSYAATHAAPLLKGAIQQFKEKGELIDWPVETILRHVATHIFGLFVSRFLLMETPFISDEEVEEVVQFILNGIKNQQ